MDESKRIYPDDFCPYKGLEPYEESDREFFFGRESDIDIVASNFFTSTLTFLYGMSGVGKSSLLMAGIVPRFRHQPKSCVIPFRSWQGGGSSEALKSQIVRSVADASHGETNLDAGQPLDILVSQCSSESGVRLYFIFDQFEDYLLYTPPSDENTGFEAELARIVNSSSVRANFLIAIRQEDFARLDRFNGRIQSVLDRSLRLKHLDRQSAMSAILVPIERYNAIHDLGLLRATIDPNLASAVLDEIDQSSVNRRRMVGVPTINQDAAIDAPLLQLIMTSLWQDESHGKTMSPGPNLSRHGTISLRQESLTALGGSGAIVSNHLRSAISRLTDKQRDVASQLFDRLVTPSAGRVALSVQDLATYTNTFATDLDAVLKELSQRNVRILRTAERLPGTENEPKYEVSSDTLATAILRWRPEYEREREDFLRDSTTLSGLGIPQLAGIVRDIGEQNILIVDDLPSNCARYQALLTKLVGGRITVATSKADALNYFANGLYPSVVLLDVCLPNPEDGCEVCASIKRGTLGAETQVIMITALGEGSKVLAMCLEAGADDFLGREVPAAEVVLRVRSKLQTHASLVAAISARLDLERKATVAEYFDSLHHDVLKSLTFPNDMLRVTREFAQQVQQFVEYFNDFGEATSESLTSIRHQLDAVKNIADAGGSEEVRTVRLREKLPEVSNLVNYRVLKHGSVLKLHFPADYDPKIIVSWPVLLVTLQELIMNAATIIEADRDKSKKQKDGLIELSVEPVVINSLPWVQISVSDNGPGVPDHIVPTIFDRGVTSRSNRGRTGRGLFFAKERIGRVGGTIRYEHNQPTGARFIIELPEVG